MAKSTSQKMVLIYQDQHGAEPFMNWLHGLKDANTRRRILTRLIRLEQGNYGDCKPIGAGLSELRLFFGSGYRIYFGEHEKTIVIILNGGNKTSQKSDIKLAKSYWKEYLDHDGT